MTLRFATAEGPLVVMPRRLVVAGWTGRDPDSVRHHVEELAAIGVPPPSRTPLGYAVSPGLLTQQDTIHCLGADTSGEAEPVVIHARGRRWLTLGSDHTDRALEAHSVAHAKQACAKPLAAEVWLLDDALGARLDALRLTSEVGDDGETWMPYQDGTLAALLPLPDILEAVAPDAADGTLVLCGTMPAIGGVRPARHMRMTLSDAEAGRRIALAYRTLAMPIVA